MQYVNWTTSSTGKWRKSFSRKHGTARWQSPKRRRRYDIYYDLLRSLPTPNILWFYITATHFKSRLYAYKSNWKVPCPSECVCNLGVNAVQVIKVPHDSTEMVRQHKTRSSKRVQLFGLSWGWECIHFGDSKTLLSLFKRQSWVSELQNKSFLKEILKGKTGVLGARSGRVQVKSNLERQGWPAKCIEYIWIVGNKFP